MSTAEKDSSITTITGYITVGFEKNLRAAAQIANEHGYRYLSDEHLLLALAANPKSYLVRNWPEGLALTLEQLTELLQAALPPLPDDSVRPDVPVQVSTEWSGPHADHERTTS